MRKRSYSPKRQRKVRLPQPSRPNEHHWLDRFEREREDADEALRLRIEASEREQRTHG